MDLDGDRSQFLSGLGTVALITDLSRSDSIERAKNLFWADALPLPHLCEEEMCFFQSRFVTRPNIRASSAKAVYITFIHVDKWRGVEKAFVIWRKMIGLLPPAWRLTAVFGKVAADLL